MKIPANLRREITIGLDDIAHNRLYFSKGKKWVKVKNYGRRNRKHKCYCKELKRGEYYKWFK